MYTIVLIIHVDDYHSTPTPKVVETLDEVVTIIESVQDAWDGNSVRVSVLDNTYTLRVD